ncbi:MAG: GxxExxY protein [Flavobacteriales bacterium]|nr:GxxExxY protein [Flavobacteriales bacterium]
MKAPVNKTDLLYPELSYQIMGCAFDVHNELGGGLLEKVYQKALAVSFKNRNINFKEQAHFPIVFEGEKVGTGYFDFLVDEKIVVELKRTQHFSRKQIEQVVSYLKQSNLKLGILIHFGQEQVRYKRIIND